MVIAHANHLVSQGCAVTFLTGETNTVFSIDPRVEFRSIGDSGKIGTLWAALSGRLDADVIIADIIPLAVLLFLRNRGRVVYFAQDYDEAYYSRVPLKILVRFLYFAGLTVFRIPVVAVSEYLQGLFRRRFNAVVTVAANGIDTEVFTPHPDPVLQKNKRGKKAILVLGRDDPRKGLDLARAALVSLKERGCDPFVVWSVGLPLDKLEDIETVDFGYVDESRLSELMSTADIFLYPSRHEGFGLMPLEALACGCPLVTTDAVKIVSHNENALVAHVDNVEQLSESMWRLLHDDALAEKLRLGGRRLAKKYSLANSLESFADAIACCTDSGHSTREEL